MNSNSYLALETQVHGISNWNRAGCLLGSNKMWTTEMSRSPAWQNPACGRQAGGRGMFRDMPEQDSMQLDPLLGAVWLWISTRVLLQWVSVRQSLWKQSHSARTGGLGDSAEASGSAQPLHSILSRNTHDPLSSFECHCASHSWGRADQSQKPHLFLNISP